MPRRVSYGASRRTTTGVLQKKKDYSRAELISDVNPIQEDQAYAVKFAITALTNSAIYNTWLDLLKPLRRSLPQSYSISGFSGAKDLDRVIGLLAIPLLQTGASRRCIGS
jgi:hypothetical protein